MTRIALAAPFLALAFAVACGGSTDTSSMPGDGSGSSSGGSSGGSGSSSGAASSSGGDDGGAAITSDQACADLARARCQRGDACSASTYVATRYGDEATCEARLKQQCVANLAAPSTGGTAATIEACAQAVPNESCSDYFGDDPPAACLPQAGQLANGAACGASGQCASTYCAIGANAACGACADPPAAGAACATAEQCGNRGGLACVAGACAAYAAQGGSCDKSTACGPGLSCVGATKNAPGACQPDGSSAGATCDPKQGTAPRCDGELDLVCDGATKQCVQESIASAGQPCGVVTGGFARCGASGTCAVAASDAGADAGASTSGTCVAAVADGAACDTASGPSCMPPAKCVVAGDGGTSGTCTFADPSACQ